MINQILRETQSLLYFRGQTRSVVLLFFLILISNYRRSFSNYRRSTFVHSTFVQFAIVFKSSIFIATTRVLPCNEAFAHLEKFLTFFSWKNVIPNGERVSHVRRTIEKGTDKKKKYSTIQLNLQRKYQILINKVSFTYLQVNTPH